MNSLKYKVFWWIWLPMALKKSSRVVLMTILGKNIFISDSQYGFRHKHSTINAITEFTKTLCHPLI